MDHVTDTCVIFYSTVVSHVESRLWGRGHVARDGRAVYCRGDKEGSAVRCRKCRVPSWDDTWKVGSSIWTFLSLLGRSLNLTDSIQIYLRGPNDRLIMIAINYVFFWMRLQMGRVWIRATGDVKMKKPNWVRLKMDLVWDGIILYLLFKRWIWIWIQHESNRIRVRV